MRQAVQPRSQPRPVVPPGGTELVYFPELVEAERGLQIRRLQVVADVGENVLVVVALRQGAHLLLEPLEAAVVLAGLTPAVPSPVPQRLHDAGEHHVVGQHTAALAHGDVVGRVEALGGQIPEGARQPAPVGAAEGIAVVLDEEQPAVAGDLGDLLDGEGVAERMGDHDGPGARTDGLRDPLRGGVVGAEFDVDEDRHQTVLQDRVDRRGKAGRHGDDLVAGHQPEVLQLVRGQRAERQEVGRGTRVGQMRLAQPEIPGQRPLEPAGTGTGRDPQIQGRLDEGDPVLLVEHRARRRDRRHPGHKSGCDIVLVVRAYLIQNVALAVPHRLPPPVSVLRDVRRVAAGVRSGVAARSTTGRRRVRPCGTPVPVTGRLIGVISSARRARTGPVRAANSRECHRGWAARHQGAAGARDTRECPTSPLPILGPDRGTALHHGRSDGTCSPSRKAQ